MPHISSMFFPEHLSIAGVTLSNGRSEGITNHAFLKTLVDELVEKSGFREWKAGDPVHVTRKALKRKKEEYDGEGPVEILGEEWKANDNDGRWATPGLMEVLRSCRYYEITYRFRPRTGSPDVYKTGYTNSYSIAKGIERILKLPGRPYSRFDKCDVKLVASEKDFKIYQDSDGGCRRLFKKGVDGEIIDDGWITKGLFAVCEVAAGLIPKKKRRRRRANKVRRVHYPTKT